MATTEPSHNVKATYVNYLGWFDGNPANLHTHPPEDAAKRCVEFMGGAQATLDKAHGAYDLGDYRWVACTSCRHRAPRALTPYAR